jgi:hypothetical protein
MNIILQFCELSQVEIIRQNQLNFVERKFLQNTLTIIKMYIIIKSDNNSIYLNQNFLTNYYQK